MASSCVWCGRAIRWWHYRYWQTSTQPYHHRCIARLRADLDQPDPEAATSA